MRLGSHLSVAGGVANAVREAVTLGLDSVQVFTANQRQWAPRAPSAAEIAEWFVALADAGWSDPDDVRVVSHNSYLCNMASPDATARTRSRELQRAELERCEALSIRRCVMHPGAHLGEPAPKIAASQRADACTPDEMAGLERLARELDALHASTAGFKVLTCLETTAGAGTALGYDFRHLALLRDMVGDPARIGFCFDTCHATVAGYDMTTDAGARETVDRLFDVLGLARGRAAAAGTRRAEEVLVFHLNDSKGAVASRLDRHDHIGAGLCGTSCFRAILTTPEFAECPGILETPKEGDFEGRPWDAENVRRLKAIEAGIALAVPAAPKAAAAGKREPAPRPRARVKSTGDSKVGGASKAAGASKTVSASKKSGAAKAAGPTKSNAVSKSARSSSSPTSPKRHVSAAKKSRTGATPARTSGGRRG